MAWKLGAAPVDLQKLLKRLQKPDCGCTLDPFISPGPAGGNTTWVVIRRTERTVIVDTADPVIAGAIADHICERLGIDWSTLDDL